MIRFWKINNSFSSRVTTAVARFASLEKLKHPPKMSEIASANAKLNLLLNQSMEANETRRSLRSSKRKKRLELRAVTILCLSIIALIAVIMLPASVLAQTEQATTKRVEFTQIQDLNTKTKPINRPVRQKWAVVVGINKFLDHRLDSEQPYDKAARQFAAYLESPKGGRFRTDHVRLLTDEKATQQSINNSFGDSWFGKLVGEDDLVVVYVATRSFPTTDGNSYLCSYNCSMDNIFGTCLSIQSLMQTLRSNIKSDRIVLVIESAYSGGADLSTTAKPALPNFNVDLEKVTVGKGLMILTSSRADQLSWKTLFTDNLISSLQEKEGLVPLEEAFIKAKQKTEVDSVNRVYMGRKQTPVMKSDWQGNDLVLGCEPLDSTTGIPESMQNFLGAEAHYLNANKSVINGDLEKAIAEYQESIKADPGLTDARADYAVALGMKGQWKEAEEELRKAIAIRPNDPLYLTNYARVLDKLGNKDECKRMLEKAYTINPKDRVILVALSDKNMAAGDKANAMRLMDQALILYPNNAIVQDRMSFLLTMDGRTEEAFAHAKEAVKLDPDLASARLKLGALLVLRGDTMGAIKEYQTVLAKNDANADAHYLIAQAYDKAKDQHTVEEYKKFLQLATAADPRRAAVGERLKTLGSAN